jgi:hypothetical protein
MKKVPASRTAERVEQTPSWAAGLSTSVILMCFAVFVLLYYWTPLLDAAASIQWDAVDVHYSPQKYFSDAVRSGHLPFWTPYVYSGFPFLSDPQVGAWYPLNWPFFLLGITPRSIEWELALHCWIAAAGAFLFAKELLGSRWAGVFCAAFYAFSGFFAGHSSHAGMFQAAALFPWLLWSGMRAVRSVRWLPAVAIVSGLLVLVGHFQTALYAFCGLALVVSGDAIQRKELRRPAAVLLCAALSALVLPAVTTLPGLELTAESERATSNYVHDANGTLAPEALLTLVSANQFGVWDRDKYTGPADITQFFFYQGILLIPLAVAGAITSKHRIYAFLLLIPAFWYAMGPGGGFYLLVAQLPGLRSVRAPIHDWFLVAFALGLLASAAIVALRSRIRSPWIPLTLLAVVCGDLWYCNMSHNRLAYARTTFDSLYGDREQRFAQVAAATAAKPMARLWAPFDTNDFGPLNGPLDTRLELTFGYNPLALARYSRYLQAAGQNPRLLDSLAVTAKLDLKEGLFFANPAALPRISAPASLAPSGSLEQLDPAKTAMMEAAPSVTENGPIELAITNYEGDRYRAHYRAAHPTVVRLAVPYFPGWHAEVDGQEQRIFPLDVALIGTQVPAGSHDLVFRYRSNWFATGATVSCAGWLAILGWIAFVRRRRDPGQAPAVA